MSKSPDENPKSEVAEQIVTAKRMYFLPDLGVAGITIEAENSIEAAKLAKKQLKDEQSEKVSDGE